jgi:hypothetical protein
VDVMHARLALRERSILDVLDLSVRFVSAHKAIYLRTMAPVLVAAFLSSWAFARAAGWAWGWLGAVLLSLPSQAPFTALASRLVFDDRVRARDALTSSLRAMPRLAIARLIQIVALSAALAFFVLPSLWVGGATLFLGEVVLLEQSTVGRSFGRAQRIAATDVGSAIVGVALVLLVPLAAALLTDITGRAVLEDLLEVRAPASLWGEGGSWLALLGFWAAVPFAATVRFLTYVNFRTRSEGWDIQTRFAALATRGPLE